MPLGPHWTFWDLVCLFIWNLLYFSLIAQKTVSQLGDCHRTCSLFIKCKMCDFKTMASHSRGYLYGNLGLSQVKPRKETRKGRQSWVKGEKSKGCAISVFPPLCSLSRPWGIKCTRIEFLWESLHTWVITSQKLGLKNTISTPKLSWTDWRQLPLNGSEHRNGKAYGWNVWMYVLLLSLEYTVSNAIMGPQSIF